MMPNEKSAWNMPRHCVPTRYYRGGKRIREAVGPNKKEAQEYLGKKLREIRDEELFGIKKR
jgi:hypothetical protein